MTPQANNVTQSDEPNAGPRDTLLHIADLHFWAPVTNPLLLIGKRFLGNLHVLFRRRKEFIMDRASTYIEYAAATGIKPVILTGDFTSTSTQAEFALGRAFVKDLAARGFECWAIPGNHDVYTFASARNQRFEQFFKEWLPAPTLPAAVQLPGGTDVVFVPTVSPNMLSSEGDISNEDVSVVSDLLANARSPLVVAAHYPVLHETHGYTTRPGRRLRNAEALRRALGESGKSILYICGHVHRFSYAQDADYPNVTYVTTGGFIRQAEETSTAGEFAEVHVYADRFDVFRHVRTDSWRVSQEQPHAQQSGVSV